MISKIFRVEPHHTGQRIDRLIADTFPELTRSFVQKIIELQGVRVDGKPVGKSFVPAEGSVVSVTAAEPQVAEVKAENIPLDIRYEDADLLVVNKPKGMVVHPAAGNREGTLVNALMNHCGSSLSGINGVIRPGIVHRIDKYTSGLLLVAKNDFAHRSLAAQLKNHSIRREYRAVVCGCVKLDEGRIEAPIGRNPKDRKKMCVTQKNSRHAVTNYTVLSRSESYSYLRLVLETGRTHQIRVHMAALGHPVAGDTVYGNKKPPAGLNGQCLHAAILGFSHPRDERYVELRAELPAYFTEFMRRIRIHDPEQ